MTEAEWLACTILAPMLDHLQTSGKSSDRKLRLLACGCYRRMRPQYKYGRLMRAVNTAERYADGLIGREELLKAKSAAYDLAKRMQRFVYDRLPQLKGKEPRSLLLAAYSTEERIATLAQKLSQAANWEELGLIVPSVLRDIFGNPFRPVAADLSWLTPTLVRLAETIYGDRAFDRMPILAGALEEAGCTNADLLAHCRGPGPHVRGCWAVDLILGKE